MKVRAATSIVVVGMRLGEVSLVDQFPGCRSVAKAQVAGAHHNDEPEHAGHDTALPGAPRRDPAHGRGPLLGHRRRRAVGRGATPGGPAGGAARPRRDPRRLLQPAVAHPGDRRDPREAARAPARAPRRPARDRPRPLGRAHATGGRGTLRRGVRSLGGRPVHVRSRGRRVRARRPRPRPARGPRDRRVAPGRDRPPGLAQGNPAARPLEPARLRSPRLPGPSRSVPGLPERRGLLRSGARAPDALQRHVALLESPAPAGAEPVELVGRAASVSRARTVASPPRPGHLTRPGSCARAARRPSLRPPRRPRA